MEKETTNLNTTKTKSLYFLSFIEGGSLMAVEIMSAKIIAPYFGNSIYVWAAVLATTLLGLAGGYFVGGNLSIKNNARKTLFKVSFIGAFLTIILPFTSTFILQNTLSLGLQLGTIIAAFFILFPIVFCFGMVSPLIIFLTSQQYKNSGKNASVVYTVSTVGGILFALLTGLYLVTTIGVQYSHFFIGGLLFVTTLITFLISKKN